MNNNKANKTVKKAYKFNIVDTVALIIAFVVALTVFLWMDPFDWIHTEIQAQDKTILYVVELRAIEKSNSSSVKVNDDVVFVTHGVNLGKVVATKKAPSLRWDVPKEGDQMLLMQNPLLDTLFVTIEVECSYMDGIGYFLDGEQLLVGEPISLEFPMFDAIGECVSISVKE